MQFNTTHFFKIYHNGFQFSAIFARIFRKSRDFRKKSRVLSGTSLPFLFFAVFSQNSQFSQLRANLDISRRWLRN